MTVNNYHSFGGIPLRFDGSKAKLSEPAEPSEDPIIKIEIDPSIASKAPYKTSEILEALRSNDITADMGDIAIGNNVYSVKLIPPKTVTYKLGASPEKGEDISSRFLGTVCVAPMEVSSSIAVEERNNWQKEPSYKKFHKPVPFGYDSTFE